MELGTKPKFRQQFRNGILDQFRPVEAHEPQQLNWNKQPVQTLFASLDLSSGSQFRPQFRPVQCTMKPPNASQICPSRQSLDKLMTLSGLGKTFCSSLFIATHDLIRRKQPYICETVHAHHCIVWYHSGMSDQFQKEIIEAYEAGKILGLCCTDACGMVSRSLQ